MKPQQPPPPKTEAGATIAPPRRLRQGLLLALVLLVTAAAFIPSLRNGFVAWDDDLYVYNNEDIKRLDGAAIHKFFTSFYVRTYQPLTMISYALDYRLGGLNPEVYHGVNLAWHLGNTALVFCLILLLTRRTAMAFIVSLFFGIHPMHVESVAWIAERKDLLYAFFYLGGLIAYTRALSARARARVTGAYLLTLFLFILSCLSKAAAITFPLLLPLIEFYTGKRLPRVFSRPSHGAAASASPARPHDEISGTRWRDQLAKIPFFLLALAFGILALVSQRVIGPDPNYITGYTIFDRITMGAAALVFYLVRAFFPLGLSALHPLPTKVAGLLPFTYYFALLLAITLITLLIWLVVSGFVRNSPVCSAPDATPPKDLLFGALFFFFTLVLVLALPVGMVVTAERYTYLPYIGIFMIVGRLYLYLHSRGPARPALARGYTILLAAVALIFIGITYNRTQVWHDTTTLFSDVIAKYPAAAAAYTNRGSARMERGDFAGARADFDKAVQLDDPNAWTNRGALRSRLGDYPGALADFALALRRHPHSAAIYYSRGVTRLRLGDFTAAEADFSQAVALDPHYLDAWHNRGLVRYEHLAQAEAAARDFDAAIALAPSDPDLYYNRGNAKLRYGDYPGAVTDYDLALQLKPDYGPAWFNRGLALLLPESDNPDRLRRDEACRGWEKAAALGVAPAQEVLREHCR